MKTQNCYTTIKKTVVLIYMYSCGSKCWVVRSLDRIKPAGGGLGAFVGGKSRICVDDVVGAIRVQLVGHVQKVQLGLRWCLVGVVSVQIQLIGHVHGVLLALRRCLRQRVGQQEHYEERHNVTEEIEVAV